MKDYKFNTRCFKRWVEHECEIFKQSKALNNLPEDYENPLFNKSQSKRSAMSSDHLSSESPVKRRFIVKDESTSEED